MKSLKVIISPKWPPGLLRLSGPLMKLKSPHNSQSSLVGISSENSQAMKLFLGSPWQGPYTLTKVQDWADWVEWKRVTSAKSLEATIVAEKTALFQMVAIPPDAPREGTKSNLSNLHGQQDLMKALSKDCFFVSCKQITAQPLELIALESANCLASEFSPRTFQQRMFQLTKRGIRMINKVIRQH